MALAAQLKREAKSMSGILLRGAEVAQHSPIRGSEGGDGGDVDEDVRGLAADPLRHVGGSH